MARPGSHWHRCGQSQAGVPIRHLERRTDMVERSSGKTCASSCVLGRQPGFALAAVLTVALESGPTARSQRRPRRAARIAALQGRGAAVSRADGYPTAAPTHVVGADFMSVRENTASSIGSRRTPPAAVTMLGWRAREVRAASVSDGCSRCSVFRTSPVAPFCATSISPAERRCRLGLRLLAAHTSVGMPAAIGPVDRALAAAAISSSALLAQGARLARVMFRRSSPEPADVYLPIGYDGAFNAAAAAPRRSHYLGVLARARANTTATLIDEDLRRIGAQLQAAFPDSNDGLTMNAISVRDLIVGDLRTPLFVLLGAVGLVLLIACANVASLMLARASARSDELAVRAALGARRGRLLRQLLTEAVVLGLIGGALGLALAYAGTTALIAAEPADIPRLDEITLDWTVVLFTLAISVLASLGFGALPALQATGPLTRGLRAGGRGGGADRNAQRVRAVLVVGEVALAVVLLAGAGLLLRSLVALTHAAPGFTSATRSRSGWRSTSRLRLTRAYSRTIRNGPPHLPGVTAVAAPPCFPEWARSAAGLRVRARRRRPMSTPRLESRRLLRLLPDHRRDAHGGAALHGPRSSRRATVGSSTRLGFDAGSPMGSRSAAVDGVARAKSSASSPICCREIETADCASALRSVRAAHDARDLAVRPHGRRSTTAGISIRSTIRRFDPDLAVSELTLLDDLRAGANRRTAVLHRPAGIVRDRRARLAVTGIFGVMSYTVAERAREIGIRMALGAQSATVLRMIVGRAVGLALSGAVLGLAGALVIGRVIRSQLYGVGVLDPPTLAAVILILLTSVAAASLLPARPARLDPIETLRQANPCP